MLLVGGNKAGDWTIWYRTAIRDAEQAYEIWLEQEQRARKGDIDG